MIETARAEESGQPAAGGNRVGGDLKDGYFIRSTVFIDVDNSSYIAPNEVFGPVLSIIRFTDEADVIALANDTTNGLAASMHTNELKRAHRVAAQFEAGW
jgi:acyl-CoA reductase-like NAD-dependent aldehyde dehydrogenase